MIDRSLILLARLRWGAFLRKIRRGLSTKRGIAFTVIGGMIFMMWLVPAILGVATGQARNDPAAVREHAPVIMLVLTLVMAFLSGGKIITFSAAEIDHLFPGPYSRHELVLYKIGVIALATLGVAAMVSLWQWRSASFWIAGFLGIWLAWLFAQSLAMLIILSRQAFTARRSSPLVRAALVAMLILIVAAIYNIARPTFGGEFNLPTLLKQSRDALPARIVLAPFEILTATMTAQRVWPDMIQWAAASVGMIIVLIALILRLDGHFIESSLTASEQVLAKVRRMRRGGSTLAAAARPVQSLRVPMLPRLGGVGPVFWRQLMIAVRGARGLLMVLVLVLLGVGPMIWAMAHKGGKAQDLAIPAIIGASVWLVFALPSLLKFDFRGDILHIDALKLLPLRPSVIVIGQLLTPIILISLFTWTLASIVAAMVPSEQVRIGAAVGAAFIPPLIALVIGVENASFLLFPTAQKMTTPGDMTMLGRTMVTVFIKMLALMGTLAIVGGVGTGLYFLTKSWPITIAGGWLLLAGSALLTVPLIARLFVKFDPSIDTPAV